MKASQDPETEEAKWNLPIIHFIFNTCALPDEIYQNVCREKDVSSLLHLMILLL